MLALTIGFSSLTVIVAIVVTMLPSALLWKSERRSKCLNDWVKAKGKLQGNAFVDTQGVPWLKGSEGPLFDREVRKKIRR